MTSLLPDEPNDQGSLFDPAPAPPLAGVVAAAVPTPEVLDLSAHLARAWGRQIRLGTSSWYFPGWAGLVWARSYSEAAVVKHGLAAYAQHPLLGTVSLDRSFYRPVDVATYARLAAQVPAGFRFMVKAPASVTDATVREAGSGRALQPEMLAPGRRIRQPPPVGAATVLGAARHTVANPLFLDPATALEAALRPAVAGLGDKLGVLVFQLSPLPRSWLADQDALHQRLERLLAAIADELPAGALCAVEVRDPELLTPAFARLLVAHGARYCLGLHNRMPPIAEQLPMLRAQWPGPLVCRWNLQRGLAYERAKNLFEPFDKLAAPDPATRQALARVMVATAQAGHPVFVAINNKAEGSAPLSVIELAREMFAPLPSSSAG